jgi:hypothetical protein
MRWLLANGQVPTRSWFIKRLVRFCDNSIADQSMCAGGATALAEADVSHNSQAAGRWASLVLELKGLITVNFYLKALSSINR